MKKTLIALVLAAMTAPLAASATESNGIGYTYAQLDYVYQGGSSGPYLNGGQLSGSYAFTDNFFMTGSYAEGEDTYYGTKYDSSVWSLGAGYAMSIGSRADWVSQLSYVDQEMTLKNRKGTCGSGIRCKWHENYRGAQLSSGIRGRVTDSLTLNGYLGYQDYDADHDWEKEYGYDVDYKGNFFADFGATYAFNKTWGLHAGLTLSQGTDTASLGVRASF